MQKTKSMVPEKVQWFTTMMLGELLVPNKTVQYAVAGIFYIVLLFSLILAGTLWGVYFWIVLSAFIGWNLALSGSWGNPLKELEKRAEIFPKKSINHLLYKNLRLIVIPAFMLILSLLFAIIS